MKHIGIILLCIFAVVSCKTTSPFKIRPYNPPAEEKSKEDVLSDLIVALVPEESDEIPAAIDEAKDIFVSADDVVIPEQTEDSDEHFPFVMLTSEDFIDEVQETIVDEPIDGWHEITASDEDEQAESILGASETTVVNAMDDTMDNPMVVEQTEQKTVLQTIEDAVKGEGEPKEAVVAGNVLPMWFVYTFAFLFLSCLFTLCYLSKNRRWRRVHGD